MQSIITSSVKTNWVIGKGSIVVELEDTMERVFRWEYLFELGNKKSDNSYQIDTQQLINERLKAIKQAKSLMGEVFGDKEIITIQGDELEVVAEPEAKEVKEAVAEPEVKEVKEAVAEPEVKEVKEVKEAKPKKAKATKPKEVEPKEKVIHYTEGNPKMQADCKALILECAGVKELKDLPMVGKLVLDLKEDMTNLNIKFYVNGELSKEVKELFRSKTTSHIAEQAGF